MNMRSLGSLANLAKILEEASDPNSELREDRKETRVKVVHRKSDASRQVKAVDPKRKAWHDRRLRELANKAATPAPVAAAAPAVPAQTQAARAAATGIGTNLLSVIAKANQPAKDDTKKPEAWRRKPGDPIF